MNERLNIRIHNLTTIQMKVYRALRTSMGLQRYEAKIAMLGYLLGEETGRTILHNYSSIIDRLIEISQKPNSEELSHITHEWEHHKQNLAQTAPKHKASVLPKA